MMKRQFKKTKKNEIKKGGGSIMFKIVNVLCVFICLVLVPGCVTENIIPIIYEAAKSGPLYTMEFPDKLEKCEPYSSTFKHPLTNEVLRREIVGIEGDKCVYIEEMPNGGMMICKFSDNQRRVVAQYYRDELMAQKHMTFDEYYVETKYYINGKEVYNPLQEALNCGLCVIEGYGEEQVNYFPIDK
ncbi:MAG: hypothetical protein PVH61_07095 [Candidatus Aminicenantes bacterium]|jgi:hypothetical protein